jgi:hypothetical protein
MCSSRSPRTSYEASTRRNNLSQAMVVVMPLTTIFTSLEYGDPARRSFCQQEQSYWSRENMSNRPPRLESLETKPAFRLRRSLPRPHALHERRIRPTSEKKHRKRQTPQCLWSQHGMAWVSCSGSTMLIVRSSLSHLQSLDPGLNGNLPALDQNVWLSRFSPTHLKYVHLAD